MFRKVSETPEWQDYVQRTSQSGRFIGSDEMRGIVQAEESATREIFAAEGWLAN
ncbi:hypothetical protein ACFQU7_24360 [Pseudoroseomonas wenyumeiae]